jgi:hypothetical protein
MMKTRSCFDLNGGGDDQHKSNVVQPLTRWLLRFSLFTLLQSHCNPIDIEFALAWEGWFEGVSWSVVDQSAG